jgi:hypothetical protein
MMEGLDLDLHFLNNFVNEEISNGKPQYDKSKSLTLENVGSAIPNVGLNYTPYKPE